MAGGCPRAIGPQCAGVDVLVVAPHPDDEVLMAGGVLARAVREGRRAAVVVVTSGGLSCKRDGPRREAETVAALQAIGLAEADVHFLGYPDGFLSRLGAKPLAAVEQLDASGQCVKAASTSATHGANHLDEHQAREGAAAPFTAPALEGDLTALLTRLQPTDVYLPHPLDEHPDHAATYALVRRALVPLEHAPTLHRAIVHLGRCWPGDCEQPYQPRAPMPPLPAPLAGYLPDERWPVDGAAKLQWLSHYPSQVGPTPATDWLASFARSEEVFFGERLERDPRWGWTAMATPATREVALSFERQPRVRLTVGGEPFSLSVEAGELLLRHGEQAVRTWPLPDEPFVLASLRIDPQPSGFSEFGVWGSRGLVGVAVVPTVEGPVQCAAEQAVGACMVSTRVAATGISRGVTR